MVTLTVASPTFYLRLKSQTQVGLIAQEENDRQLQPGLVKAASGTLLCGGDGQLLYESLEIKGLVSRPLSHKREGKMKVKPTALLCSGYSLDQ